MLIIAEANHEKLFVTMWILHTIEYCMKHALQFIRYEQPPEARQANVAVFALFSEDGVSSDVSAGVPETDFLIRE